ncbi:MAG: NUDIX hydrolase, partial [Henriciella sp.]|nr:NUDIX hydrolase [Henriciella sp.]
MTKLIKTAYDKEGDGDTILQGKPSPRPKDAATLILVRRDASKPRVLMGKRSGRHDFMPDKYVFPGGRVDPQDGRVTAYSELSTANEKRLRHQSRRLPRALALTAIRETFEETGLLIGRNAEMPATSPAGWP